MAQNNNPIRYSDLIAPDDSITKLIAQLDEASDAYMNMAKNIKSEASTLAAALERVSGATEDGRTVTREAANDADKLVKAQRELNFAESENAKKLAELKLMTKEQNDINKLLVKINNTAEGSYSRLSAQYSLNKIYINNMTQAERDYAEETEGLITKTREIYEQMKQMQEETGKHQLNVGNYTEASDAIINYSDKLKESLGLNNAFGNSLLAIGKGGDEGKAALTAIGDGAKALGKTLMGLMSNPVFLGIAGIAGAGMAFKWWYDYNANLEEATRLTQQFTGKEGDDLKAYRNEVQAVADSFGKDFQETLIATNAVAQQFGISANEALTIVKDGFIAGGDANGEFLDNIKEFPAYFHEAGISADEFVAIVAQTNKMGIFSDKGIDAIKEANTRLREMTTATADALDGIGISATQVEKDLASGTKTTFDVIKEISARLNEMPDTAQATGAAIADIFGGPGEDAGLQYLRTLKDISTNLDEAKDKAGVLGKLQEEQLQSQLDLQNALSALFDQTGGNFETLKTRVKTFTNDALTGLIKGVISLVNYFIDLYNDSVAFRAIIAAIVTNVKNGIDTIGNLFKALTDQIKALGTILKGVFTLNWDTLKQGIKEYGDATTNMLKEQIKDVKENINEGVDSLNKKVKPITIPVTVAGDTAKASQGGAQSGTNGKDTATTQIAQQGKEIEAAYKKNLEATRKLQDAQLSLITDGYAKQTQQTKYQYERQIEDLQHQLATEKDLTKTEKEAITAEITSLQQKEADALLKIEQDRQLQELNLTKQGIELKLQAVAAGSEQEKELKLQQIEVDKQIALLQNQQKPAGERQSASVISAGYDVKKGQTSDDYLQVQLAAFDAEQELAQSEFDLLKNSEARKTEFQLQAEKERWQKILELNETAANKMSDTQIQTIENTIKKIDQEIEQTKKDERGNDIYGLFGLNLDDQQKEAIDTSFQYALDALNEFTDARIEAADAAVTESEKEVDAAQSVLDAQLEASANGYANNVAQAQKELDLAKKNQEKALKQQQQAQKQQQAIQTLQQIGNMVTATAKIWAQLGFPYAIPAIAVMWASFAASKIKAAQLAKSGTEQYGEGTVEMLKGGSHQSGNDVDLGTKPDGTKRRAEGGEFFAVINKANSRRYRKIIPDVINSLNNGTFAHKYINAYAGAEGLTMNVTENKADFRQLSDDVRAIRDQNARKTYVDGKGNVITVYKNLTRTIKS